MAASSHAGVNDGPTRSRLVQMTALERAQPAWRPDAGFDDYDAFADRGTPLIIDNGSWDFRAGWASEADGKIASEPRRGWQDALDGELET